MTAAIRQQKAVGPGEIRRWELDLAAAAACAAWARSTPELLADELQQLASAFPTMIAAVGLPLGDDRCWVEAYEPLLSPAGELVVFDRGTRCARTGQHVELQPETAVGTVLRMPSPIDGRPFVASLDRRLEQLERRDPARAQRWRQALLEVDGRRFLAPRFGLWFPACWPHADPPVMVWSEYFEMLDIPPDHVYFADEFYRLCLYANWREQPAVVVLQNRVAPRLLIDLMLADLQALGRLEQALDALELSLYEMYNIVGRPQQVASLRQVYRELVGRDVEGETLDA